MRSVLYSGILRKRVNTPKTKGKSKLVEILVLRKKDKWQVEEVMIESGMVNRKGVFFSVSDVKYDREKKVIELSKPLEKGRRSPKEHELFLSRVDGSKVISHDGKELGRIYDFEMYTEITPWKVWKMLINPSGLSPLKRRDKIPTKAVKDVTSKKIKLKKGWGKV